MATIDEARDLKQRWKNLIEAGPTGVGLTHVGGGGGDGWGLKVNTAREPAGDVPSQIDGLPLTVEHAGTVSPL